MAPRTLALLLLTLACQVSDSSGQEDERYVREAFVRKISLEIDSDLRGFKEEPFTEKTALTPVEDRWEKLGFIPFVREYGRSVYPNTVPAQTERGGVLTAFAAPGEAEPMAFGVRCLDQPLSGVRLDCSGLENIDTTGSIPAEAIELSVVEYWRVRWGNGSAARGWRWHPTRIWPVLNFPGDPFGRPDYTGLLTLAARSCRSFRLTIRTPRDAVPGLYSGEVVVGTDLGAYRFPVEFTVLSVPLDKAGDHVAGVMLSGPQDAAACRDLAAHGVSGTSQWYDPEVLPPAAGRIAPTFDYSVQDAYMRRLSGEGMDGPHLIFAGSYASPRFDNALAAAGGIAVDSAGYLQTYALAVQDIFDHARKNNWPSLAWGILDRSDPGSGGLEWFRSRAAELRRIAPLGGIRLVSPILGDTAGVEPLRPLVDYWLVVGETRLDDRPSNHLLWGFDFCTQRDSASAARWRVGFGPWRQNLDGVFIWAWNWAGGGHPWNDFDAPVMDWMLSYRDPDDNYIPTPAWEGFREGVDDRLYLRTLQGLLAVSPPDSPLAAEALNDMNMLHRLLLDPDADLAALQLPDTAPASNDLSAAGTARRLIAGHIIRLARGW